MTLLKTPSSVNERSCKHRLKIQQLPNAAHCVAFTDPTDSIEKLNGRMMAKGEQLAHLLLLLDLN